MGSGGAEERMMSVGHLPVGRANLVGTTGRVILGPASRGHLGRATLVGTPYQGDRST
jgi:hypothetical protein